MMGQQKSEAQLFNYAVNLEKRVRSNHPLRKVKAAIDFGIAREEVAHCYGKNGNESVAPEVILKMIFLLFFGEIKSERELMEVIGRAARPDPFSRNASTVLPPLTHPPEKDSRRGLMTKSNKTVTNPY